MSRGKWKPKEEKQSEVVNMVTAEYAYNLATQLRMEIESRDKQIEELKAEILELRDSKLKDVKEINELEAEKDKLKGLIKKQWEIIFYSTCPGSVHEGIMDELFKNQWQKFKTENNL